MKLWRAIGLCVWSTSVSAQITEVGHQLSNASAASAPTGKADIALAAKEADPAGQIVTLSLEVDEVGHLASCKVVDSTGSPNMAAKACDKVRRSIAFKPALNNGRPVRQTTIRKILFQRSLTTPREPATPMASMENYPAEARKRGEQGRTIARLTISNTGRVTACRIEESSGSESLDKATCRIALARVRYTPAKNDAGEPVASTTTLPVRWVLPPELDGRSRK